MPRLGTPALPKPPPPHAPSTRYDNTAIHAYRYGQISFLRPHRDLKSFIQHGRLLSLASRVFFCALAGRLRPRTHPAIVATKFPWDMSTPLGRPVVPVGRRESAESSSLQTTRLSTRLDRSKDRQTDRELDGSLYTTVID